MPPRKIKEAPPPLDTEDFVRKRDAFVTSMTMLRNAADEASRAGLAYFDLMQVANGEHYHRGASTAPGHSFEEPELNENGKRRRKRTIKPKDPNAPKKPATPFFLFCSEGRGTVRKDMGENTEFKDIQAELRRRWEILPQEEKQRWSDLYQVKLADWKKVNEAYQTTKANGEATALTSADVTAAPAAGFTAVNHTAPAAADDTDEAEVEPEAEEEEEAADDAGGAGGQLEREAEATAEEEGDAEPQGSTDSSLSPPPAERPKTPRGRKPKAKAAEAPASTEKKPRKARAKKVEDTTAAAAAAVDSPRRKGRKRRKSGTE